MFNQLVHASERIMVVTLRTRDVLMAELPSLLEQEPCISIRLSD